MTEAKTQMMTLADLKKRLQESNKGSTASLPPPSTNRIKVSQSRTFVLPDGSETERPIAGVVMSYIWFNAYYSTSFRPGELSSPDCWAANKNYAALAPGACKKPVHTACEGCEFNEWGSGRDARGAPTRGKMCANKVRVVLLAEDKDGTPTLFRLDLAPTSAGEFTKYLRKLASADVPIASVLTEFSFDPKVTYSKLLPKQIAPVPDKLVPTIVSMLEQAEAEATVDLNYEE